MDNGYMSDLPEVDHVFALPLVTGSSSATAMQLHLVDAYGLTGINGKAWRALRASNERKMSAARSFGSKFGGINWLIESCAPRRGDRQ